MWQPCTCQACGGRQLDWINTLPERGEQEHAAFVHALEMLFVLRDDLTRTAGRAERQVSWREHCSLALARYEELHHVRQGWTPPAFLHHWYRLPVPTRAAT